MHNVIMGNIDGNLERIAFDISRVKQIISRHKVHIVFSADHSGLLLETGGDIYPIKGPADKDRIKPYFIILDAGMAFNVNDYQVLFNAKELPNRLVSGLDAAGRFYLCTHYRSDDLKAETGATETGMGPDQNLAPDSIQADEWKNLKDMIEKMKQGEFFEALTMEFTGKVKEIAKELIEFRKDIQKRIEPDIVEIAAKDIPEASYQLEGIIETLEKSTMKIMDINEEQMELAGNQYHQLFSLVSGNGQDAGSGIFWEEGRELTLKIRALLGSMPQEAKEAADFIMPNLNQAIEQMAQQGDPEAIVEALEEPIGIIKDLVRDCGNSQEQFRRLEKLNGRLAEMVNQVRENTQKAGKKPLTENQASETIQLQMAILKKLKDLSLSMMEPLSFQDLVGQRIQRIIKLVKTMEVRIEDLIISFGIKFRKHREDPGKSFEELKREVEIYRSELKGPQREGQGLSQRDIDDLLATL